ncbi:hypothetical protein PSEUBRA_006129 [Kalmanozyma brasiliensis GHG001]|uniref:uncharacterized protein n=1 Tax=Kalmanozyma brasiliensis (strain GHG001) TaxID=1365824 RepID=UPI001CE9F086|nr:uncharacterized protein PSEUBRA_006129 [Kalmanozyma brasiliensis GHG001]KAF6767622.1 hypothetical protein PSEUBRA_006129 [Kalmanozyma brasiliensis GHG001]
MGGLTFPILAQYTTPVSQVLLALCVVPLALTVRREATVSVYIVPPVLVVQSLCAFLRSSLPASLPGWLLEWVSILAPLAVAWTVIRRRDKLLFMQQDSLITSSEEADKVVDKKSRELPATPFLVLLIASAVLISFFLPTSSLIYTVKRLADQEPWQGSYLLALRVHAAILAPIIDIYTFLPQYLLLLSLHAILPIPAQQKLLCGPITRREAESIGRNGEWSVWTWLILSQLGLLARLPGLAEIAMLTQADEQDAWMMQIAFGCVTPILFVLFLLVIWLAPRRH